MIGHDDRGSAALELPLGLGLLVIPIALVLAVLPGLVEHRTIARSVAAEAARMVVLGDGSSATADSARSFAEAALDAYADVSVSLCGGSGCAVDRGAVVEVTVALQVPAITIPLVGEVAAIPITVSHREQVDAYRGMP